MSKEILENFQKLTQLTLDNFKKLGEANLRVGEKLLQEQVELTNAILEAASEKASDVTEAKDLKDGAAHRATMNYNSTPRRSSAAAATALTSSLKPARFTPACSKAP